MTDHQFSPDDPDLTVIRTLRADDPEKTALTLSLIISGDKGVYNEVHPKDDGFLIITDGKQAILILPNLNDDCAYRLIYHDNLGTHISYPVDDQDDTAEALAALLDRMVDANYATGGHIETRVGGIGWVVET